MTDKNKPEDTRAVVVEAQRHVTHQRDMNRKATLADAIEASNKAHESKEAKQDFLDKMAKHQETPVVHPLKDHPVKKPR